jgi:hypothetical protein
MSRKVTDKISKIESDISANMFGEEDVAAEEPAPEASEPVLVKPDFEKSSDPILEKVQAEIEVAEKALLDIDNELQAVADEFQAQLNQKQAQAEEEKNGLRIRMIELSGLKKYLNNELF